MTSQERHEARYQRRKQKRLEKKNAKLSRLGNYDTVFSYENLYEAFYLCRRGVRWKGSIQKYEATLPTSTLKIYNTLYQRKFKPMGFLEFDINERGKQRHIKALTIGERCIQRTLCDNYLNPLLQEQLIYDNGASVKGKGVSFTLNRLKCHLSRYYREYHTNEGYVLQYDFSSYFDNINHEILLKHMKKFISDREIFEVVKKMVLCFGDRGLGLGSQVSQIAAIFYPTLMDKYLKEKLHVKRFCRYMDDGIIICHSLKEVGLYKQAILQLCKKLDITINKKKFTVSKISKTFIFLKKRIRLTATGKVIMKLGRRSVINARRRLKRMFKKILLSDSKFTYNNVYQCYKSWVGNAKQLNNYYIVQNYRKLFIYLSKKYFYQKGTVQYA